MLIAQINDFAGLIGTLDILDNRHFLNPLGRAAHAHCHDDGLIIFHSEDPFSKKEMAVLYAIPMLTLLCTGAGRYSFDKFFLGK